MTPDENALTARCWLNPEVTKTALITGVTGQDGSHLVDLLLEKNYEVWGMVRRHSQPNYGNLSHVQDRVNFISGDLGDSESLAAVIREVKPDEVYNLAAQSHVHTSWRQPMYTADITGLGCLRLLDAMKQSSPEAHFYQASSSEMFGSSPAPQSESTSFRPISPYAISKVFGHHTTVNYRESYGLFAVSGILFNHEGPRRGSEFVTRKISYGVARRAVGLGGKLQLGNLEAKRDWGYAPEYVHAMWQMLQQPEPQDFVIGTGHTHSVKEFLAEALKAAKLEGAIEDHVEVDPRLIRPTEVHQLRADASLAQSSLGWRPRTDFASLVRIMVKADIRRLEDNPEFVPASVV